jgi:transposase
LAKRRDRNGRKKERRIKAEIPRPNGNVTMPMGNKVLVEAILKDTGLDAFLDGLKRDQGDSVSDEVTALVANSMEMTGISVNRLDRMLEGDDVRAEYGLTGSLKSVYRTVERLGRNSDAVVQYLGGVLKDGYGVTMGTVFMDWTSMYFEAPAGGIVRFGYSRDHRPDRPQVTVGLSMDKESGMPVGLTVMPGNVLDVTHFKETFEQIRPILPDGAMIVFDNGAYSKDNAALLDTEGFGFVTRLQLNSSDDKHIGKNKEGWIRLDDNMSYMRIEGNLGRTRFIFRSEKLRGDILLRHRRKAERDYDEMAELKASVDKGKRPRKKHRNGNCFIDTRLFYSFPLKTMTREEAIEHAAKRMATGREGLFVLLTNRGSTASETLDVYRSRNAAESAFRDLKHGIDWRPARCTSPDSVRGRILISFLALFCMSMVRFLYPEFRTKTAGSISEELGSFSLTVIKGKGGKKRRIWSNFTVIIRRISGRKEPVPAPEEPGQTSLDRFG